MSKNIRKKKLLNSTKKKQTLTLSILVFFVFLLGFLGIKSINSGSNRDVSTVFNEEPQTYEAKLLAVGDIMVHGPQLEAQYDSSSKTYSFDNNFKHVKKYIEQADYSIANLETTLAGNDVTPYSSYPLFNSPNELADALKNAGFDLISTINNHSFDKGDLGVNRTLSTLKEKGFDTVGTREKESDDEFIVKNVNNINLGITAYTYGDVKNDNKYVNGIKISEDSEDKMNVFSSSDVDDAFKAINSTVKKMDGTDMQIVILHWGVEYTRKETDFQRKLAQKLCDAGVDVIIGSHPHVVEPVETLKSTTGDNETVVIYSLGNYLSNQRRDNVGMYSEDGLMVNIDITKESTDDEAKVNKVTCIPTWVNKYYANSKNNYEIIPIVNEKDIDAINYVNKYNLQQSYNNTSSLMDTSEVLDFVSSPFN